MVAGAIGAFIGTPAEVSLIRMTSDGRLVSTCTCTFGTGEVKIFMYTTDFL